MTDQQQAIPSDEEAEAEFKAAQEAFKEKQYKDMTKEEQSERNRDILLGIGFLYREDKGQFVYKEEELTIGKTFNDKYPVGSQFWGFKGNNKLENGDIKKEDIVKQFYAIREGKQEIPEKKEEPQEERQEIATKPEIIPNVVVQDAQIKADMLYSVVEKQHLYMQIRDKKYLTLEAWEILGKFCDLTATVEWVNPVELWGSKGFEARVEIKDNKGKVISIAESMCMSDEPNWKGKPIFQLKSMSQTRAMSKAYRMCLSFIVSLAGYNATPAEEM